MKLSSAYIKEQLQKEYQILEEGGISGEDGYLRPFFSLEEEEESAEHIRIETEKEGAGRVRLLFENSGSRNAAPYLVIEGSKEEEHPEARVLNRIQRIFDRCEAWERQIQKEVLTGKNLQEILKLSADFLENPLLVMSQDFVLMGEAGTEKIPEKYRLFHADGIDMESMNALMQSAEYQKMQESREVFLFPAYINGLRSMNRNLFPEGKNVSRLIMHEWNRKFSDGDRCLFKVLAGYLELLLHYSDALEGEDALVEIFQKMLRDRTADYMEMSQRLSLHGWKSDHLYLCLLLQLTYLDQKNLSIHAICSFIKRKFPQSVSFVLDGEIVTFFDLTLLEKEKDEVAGILTCFIRDSYLKAGYSRCVKGHMYFRKQFVQARMALDVGSRNRPYVWIHHFDQVVLTYIMEQVTRRLPASMICHENLLKLKEADEENHSEYMKTLKVYLDENLSATRAAENLFIHRSTFLYRLEKIKEILQSNLDDPDEIFYLNFSFRLLEQEKSN